MPESSASPILEAIERTASLPAMTLEQWWAIEEQAFEHFMHTVHTAQPTLLRAAIGAGDLDGPRRMEMIGDVAVIDIQGPLVKRPSLATALFGATPMSSIAELVAQAGGDEDVRGIVLRIDSPGGTVAGTAHLGEAVYRARQHKPVVAHIEDLGASAAYWIASQADRVVADSSALVGSIGTFTVLRDFSRLAQNIGIETTVIRAGQFKGTGALGAPITDEQKAEIQRVVNGLNGLFLGAVARGRRMTEQRVGELADGRVHVAGEAKALGLVDAVADFDAVLEQVAQSSPRHAGRSIHAHSTGDLPMPESTTPPTNTTPPAAATNPAPPASPAPRAATVAEIKAACPGSAERADWVLAQVERGATIEQAKDAWMEQQAAALEARDAAIAERERQVAEARRAGQAGHIGDASLADGSTREGGEGGSAIERWNARVEEEMGKGRDRPQAIRRVAASDPELHQEYIREFNDTRRDRVAERAAASAVLARTHA